MFSGGVRKEGVFLPFRVSLDLTKHRLDLLKHTKELVKTNPKILYAFADVNCSLALKDANNLFHYFSNKGELKLILDKLETN